jgi:DNA-binding response OmpR family regulator
LNLPGEDGISLTERVRRAYPLAGILVATARSSLRDKLEGYTKGADLYLTKPLEVPELCAAVAALGRRRHRVGELLEQQQIFTLSQQRLTLTQKGHPAVSLSPGETAMLVSFARAPGQRLAYWQIAETLGLDLQNYPKSSLEVRIVRLRKKLVEAGAMAGSVEAVRGYGYQLCIAIQVL